MIELGDGSIKVEATDRVSEARVKQALEDPSDWVKKLSVSEQQAPQQTRVTDADMRGAVELIDGVRGATQPVSIQGAFEVWSQLREKHQSGEPVVQSAATVLSQLIGRANQAHAQSTFAEVKTGVTQAFFA